MDFIALLICSIKSHQIHLTYCNLIFKQKWKKKKIIKNSYKWAVNLQKFAEIHLFSYPLIWRQPLNLKQMVPSEFTSHQLTCRIYDHNDSCTNITSPCLKSQLCTLLKITEAIYVGSPSAIFSQFFPLKAKYLTFGSCLLYT